MSLNGLGFATKKKVVHFVINIFPERSEKTTHCKESETKISDINALKEILQSLNFTNIVTVDKARTVYECDGYEFCFDSIKNLGEFVEIELIADTDTPENEKEKLFKYIFQWGLLKSNSNNRGYPYLLMEKMGIR